MLLCLCVALPLKRTRLTNCRCLRNFFSSISKIKTLKHVFMPPLNVLQFIKSVEDQSYEGDKNQQISHLVVPFLTYLCGLVSICRGANFVKQFNFLSQSSLTRKTLEVSQEKSQKVLQITDVSQLKPQTGSVLYKKREYTVLLIIPEVTLKEFQTHRLYFHTVTIFLSFLISG